MSCIKAATLTEGPQDAQRFRELAALHMRSLPDAAASQLGARFVERLYRFSTRSSREAVFAAMDENRVVGGALISSHPIDLPRRLAFNRPLTAIFAAPLYLRARMRDRSEDRTMKKTSPTTPLSASDSPEMIYLFVSSDMRGHGVGALLTAACEEWARPFGRLLVKTEPDARAPARRFYTRIGYSEQRIVSASGRRFSLLAKSLPSLRRDTATFG